MPRGPGGNGAPRRDTGSQRALRALNRRTVVQSLGLDGPATQATLARRTGLSTGTVSNIVRQLGTEGRVSTTEVVVAGRRSIEVTLIPDPRVVLGVDIGRTHLRVMGLDSAHAPFGICGRTLAKHHTPAETLATARSMVDGMLAEHAVDRSRVALVGVAFPASLQPGSGHVLQASVLEDWAGLALAQATGEALELPVILANDADLGALAHTIPGREGAARCLVYIKVATGVGAGIVLDGQLYSSSTGVSGEIGHNQVDPSGRLCTCGNRGCLETVASTQSLADDFARIRPGMEATVPALVEAALAGDPGAERLLRDAGTVVGRALAPICNLLSPDVVVVGGPLVRAGKPLLEELERAARQRALPIATQHTAFLLSDLGDDAEVSGAALFALRQVLASEGFASK